MSCWRADDVKMAYFEQKSICSNSKCMCTIRANDAGSRAALLWVVWTFDRADLTCFDGKWLISVLHNHDFPPFWLGNHGGLSPFAVSRHVLWYFLMLHTVRMYGQPLGFDWTSDLCIKFSDFVCWIDYMYMTIFAVKILISANPTGFVFLLFFHLFVHDKTSIFE